MSVCIVGCGPSGLVASKYLKTSGINFDTYERSEEIGGIWYYTEETESDKFGEPVHTAMYQNLRTNFPKELMEFEGLKYTTNDSFLRSSEILNYLKDYADKYGLNENIKLGHKVTNISFSDDQWLVDVEDLQNKQQFTSYYKYVIVCNGHHFVPRYPDLEGIDSFKGLKVHSKDYRKPEVFKNCNLLVIGFSYSGKDMTADASNQAKTIYISHHSDEFKSEFFSDNVIPKPDVKKIGEDSVTFADGSVEKIDAILFCTGYKFCYPFLDSSCGIECDGDSVRPLYRHIINVNNPSMAFIGLSFSTIVFYVFEAQVKAFLKIILGETKLPSKKKMFEELHHYEQQLRNKGIVSKKYHMVQNERDYFKQIQEIGNIKDIPEVIYKIHFFNVEKRRTLVRNFRKYVYKVLDNQNFTVVFDDTKI